MPITTLDTTNASTDASIRRGLTNLSRAVVKSRRVVVVTGAGISCSCGIPDFRSSDGLYNLVKQQYPDVVLKGRDLFDAALFRDKTSTSVFYTFISGLKAAIDEAQPSPTHHFIHLLQKRGKLLRSYTQNIDGLEERSGLIGTSNPPTTPTEAEGGNKVNKPKIGKDVKNIQLHGDIHRVRCTVCSASYSFAKDHQDLFQKGEAPDCPECKQRCDERVARDARPVRVGTLRPAIVLYDEPHPLGDDIAAVQTTDLSKRPDLLIIMGTSLKVHGLKKLVKEFAKAVHGGNTNSTATAQPKVIFVNKTAPAAEWAGIIDIHVQGTTDEWVERVTSDWKQLKPADWETQPTLKEVLSNKNTKPTKPAKDPNSKASKPKPTKPSDNNNENIPPSAASKDAKASDKATATKKLGGTSNSAKSKSASGRIFAPAVSVKANKAGVKKPTLVTTTTKKEDTAKVRASTPTEDSPKPAVPPLSPSKRQNIESHYETDSGDETNPRKRPRSLEGLNEPNLELELSTVC